jgi:hypothetical protein
MDSSDPTQALVLHTTTQIQTSLSFALPTSLSFFKRLTWEQTPWTNLTINFFSASTISTLLTPLNPLLTPSVIQNALCIGVSYPSTIFHPGRTSVGRKVNFPHVYIVFPYLKRDVRADPSFLKVWHDTIVKPAFDNAWIDSYLVSVRKNKNGLEGSQPTTKCTAEGSEYIIDKFLLKGKDVSVHREWPDFDVREHFVEDKRVEIFEDAWDGMKGMLKDRIDLAEFREPVLLAIWGLTVKGEEGVSHERVVECVKQKWSEFADGRFCVDGSFKVVFDL